MTSKNRETLCTHEFTDKILDQLREYAIRNDFKNIQVASKFYLRDIDNIINDLRDFKWHLTQFHNESCEMQTMPTKVFSSSHTKSSNKQDNKT